MTLNEIGGQARAVSRILNSLGSREKNNWIGGSSQSAA